MLKDTKIIDLTMPFSENQIMWPGMPAPKYDTLVSVKNDGFFARQATFFEHSGTHLDAPAHFVDEGTTVEKIKAEELFRPLYVIDISSRIKNDGNGLLEVEDIHDFESIHGRINYNSVVALRTGWEEFNRDSIKYAGPAGDLKFPGFSVAAAKFLVKERKVAGIGIDTLGIDAGYASDFPVHKEVTHPAGIWHLENLQNLSLVPPVGSYIIVGVIPFVGGSGAPARVFALTY